MSYFFFINKISLKSLPIRGSTVSSCYRTRDTTFSSRVTVSNGGDGARGRSFGGSSSRRPTREAEHHGEEVVQVRVVLSATIALEGNERNGQFIVVILVLFLVIVHNDDRGLLVLFSMLSLRTIRDHFCARVDRLCGWSYRGRLGGERGNRFRLVLQQAMFIEFQNFLISYSSLDSSVGYPLFVKKYKNSFSFFYEVVLSLSDHRRYFSEGRCWYNQKR